MYAVNEKAFETPAATRLVDILIGQLQPVISLICEESLDIVGFIILLAVILSWNPKLKLMGLAPMAVAPEH